MSEVKSTRKVDWEGRTRLASEAAASLLLFHGGATRVERLGDGPRVLGRDPGADIFVDDGSVSRRHARFELQDGRVLVTDLGSTNGVRVNGTPREHAFISVRDEVTMGDVVVAVHVLSPAAGALEGHERIVELMQEEVTRAHQFRRTFALVMLELAGPPGEPLLDQIQRHLRPADHLGLFDPETVELLLPELDEGGARQLADRLVQLVQGGRAGIAVYPGAGTSAELLLTSCREAVRRATADQPVSCAASQQSSWAADVEEQPLVVRSRAMVELFEEIDGFADASLPVLLLGESGSGKEVVARELHRRGRRRDGPLACINCGAIPRTLTESTLFGHERGAFTGADARAQGVFERASGGTVLLDEVGELSAAAQVALLRVLESRVVTRIGSHREIPVDVRVIAATHRDLEEMCREGTFREDLFYRLNAIILRIPPLRERPEEIPELAQIFLQQANAANKRTVEGIEAAAVRLLCRFDWPGNVRQLRNVVERAVVLARGSRITVEDLPVQLRSPATVITGGSLDLRERVKKHEAELIVEALNRAGGNQKDAAALLNIPLRTLSRKLREHGIRRRGYGIEE
jgi:DNA-binding NtrC family response regulator